MKRVLKYKLPVVRPRRIIANLRIKVILTIVLQITCTAVPVPVLVPTTEGLRVWRVPLGRQMYRIMLVPVPVLQVAVLDVMQIPYMVV